MRAAGPSLPGTPYNRAVEAIMRNDATIPAERRRGREATRAAHAIPPARTHPSAEAPATMAPRVEPSRRGAKRWVSGRRGARKYR
jgi:hypothetical protein